jgi:N-ethylmaleimide reductase
MANNEYSLELVEEAVKEDKADLFSFARAFLANPDLVERLKTGAPLADAPKAYWYGGGETGYSDWPTMQGKPELAGASK